MAATLKGSITTALRLSSAAATALSDEIDRQIISARAEMLRAGVTSTISAGDSAVVWNAIITYALMNLGQEDSYQRYYESWLFQLDNIRKSYKWEDNQS